MGFRGVDLEEGDVPEHVGWARREAGGLREALRDVSWRRLALVVVYIGALVGAGAFLARRVSTQVGAGLVVAGLIVLVAVALKSRNRRGDPGMDPGIGMYGGGGDWDGGGGDGGGGGGGD